MDDKTKQELFERLYKEEYLMLVRLSYRITRSQEAAEDVCQDAFIKLYEHLDTLPGYDDAKFWTIKVVKNGSFNYVEHEKVRNRAFDKIKKEPTYTEDTGEKQLLKKETEEKLRKALEQLPDNLREPLSLRIYGGLDYKKIAATLNISESNVKIRIFRAREALGKLLPVGEIYVP